MAVKSETIRNESFIATEVVVGFSPKVVSAPFILRCAALLIDYFLIASVPVLFLLFGRALGDDGSNLLNGDLNSLGWLIALLVGFADLILLPILIGQSVGKFMTGTRIVSTNGHEASISRILLRQTVGYLLTLLTFGLGFLIAAFNSSGRSLHDLLFGTIVIQARKETIIR